MMDEKVKTMRDRPGFGAVAKLCGGILGLIMLCGVAAGFMQAWSANGQQTFGTKDWAIAAVWALLLAGSVWLVVSALRQIRASSADMPPRERKSLSATLIFLMVGVVVGVIFSFGSVGDPGRLLTDTALSPITAAALATVWVVPLGLGTFWWLRTIDEHERAAYREGAEHAGHAVLVGGPAWWLLHRGGILPPLSGAAVVGGFALIWSAVWLWRKYFD